jgi:hypothetical protein
MKRRALLTVLAATLWLLPSTPAVAQTPTQNIPIVGSAGPGLTFTGFLDINQFDAQGGVINAVGTLSGTVTNTAGEIVATLTDFAVNFPLTSTQGTSCQVLHLELGPLDLDVLGLVIHLNRVVLDIQAQPGPGNLLGNLLCALTGLLDADGSIGAIARFLNRILGLPL